MTDVEQGNGNTMDKQAVRDRVSPRPWLAASIGVVALAGLAGCTFGGPATSSPNGIRGVGWSQGCDAAYAVARQRTPYGPPERPRGLQNPEYAAAWQAGFADCSARYADRR